MPRDTVSKADIGIAKTMLFIMTVLKANAQSSHGQSYLLTLENVLARPLQYNLTVANSTDIGLLAEQADNATKIIFVKAPVPEKTNELSQTAMDVITIIWYVATFLALAAFFMLMACSDRRCRSIHGQQNPTPEAQRAPPTPAPSYSEFAPPSYDTVIKMQHAAKTSIFVIPFNTVEGSGKSNESQPASITTPSPQPTAPSPAPPICQVYAVNEVQKTSH